MSFSKSLSCSCNVFFLLRACFFFVLAKMAAEILNFPWAMFANVEHFPADIVYEYHSYILQSKMVNCDEEYEVLVNHHAKVALLTIGSRFTKGAIGCRAIDNNMGKSRYYRSRSTVTLATRKFFNSTLYSEYALIVDVSDAGYEIHQGGLYVVRNSNGVRYTCYAFDPNWNQAAHCLREQARMIAKIDCMRVWSTWSNNYHGLCFGLFWTFVHEILINEYDVVSTELCKVYYDFRYRKTVQLKEDSSRKSRIGYIENRNAKKGDKKSKKYTLQRRY